jgi:ATP-dependent Lon protease
MKTNISRAKRRTSWIELCARLTLVSFTAALPGPAAWAQAVERVAPLTASALSAAGASLSAPSFFTPSPLSAATLAAVPLGAPALAASPLATPLAAVPAEAIPAPLNSAMGSALIVGTPASGDQARAIETLRTASAAAASGPTRSGSETFDASRPRSGDAGAAAPASPSSPNSKGPRGSKLAADVEIAGLPAAYNTFNRLKSRMQSIGMPVEARRLAVSDFEAISRPDIGPAEAIPLRVHLKKMMDKSWATPVGAFPENPKFYTVQNVLFPGERTTLTFPVDSVQAKDILAVKSGADGGYVLAATRGEKNEVPFYFGTLARVLSSRVEGDEFKADIEGVREARIDDLAAGTRAAVTYRELPLGDGEKISSMARELSEIGKRQGQDPRDILELIGQGPRAMTDLVAAGAIVDTQMPLDEQQDLLAAETVEQRLDDAMWYLRALWPAKAVEAAKGKVAAGAAKAAAKDAAAKEVEDEFAEKIEKAGMPEKVKEIALRELKTLKSSSGAEREGHQSYLEWLTDVPWTKRSVDNVDLAKAEELMGESHTGLQMVKDRIIEFLAVRQLTKSDKGAILAFVGPPGVGKSTIAKAIAKAMGRPFVRKSVGGKTDISELVGHGRTYSKSRPGAIIRKMKEAGVVNPVFLLDEVDKMGSGERGDPMSALLDILDPEQQDTFEDTYMEVPYDLSHVLWIITINDLSKVSGPLQDRMEIIDFTSYTLDEKVRIAQKNILPAGRVKNGLKPDEARLDDDAARFLIERYTQETGVRNATKMADALFRKIATASLKDKKPVPEALTRADIESYLGKPKFTNQKAWANEPGDAWGLGVNSLGGSILSVQVRMKKGTGQLRLRKQQKEGIDDSAQNAFQVVYDYVKNNAVELGVDADALSTNDFTLAFVPAGPIDGPSAGVTMATALTSLVTGRKVREDVAMTGEIDLGGRVHPIGGLKEKVMAAHRAGKTTVLYPFENESSIQDIPAQVRAEMTLIPVSTFKQVLEFALAPAPAK